MIDAPAIFGVSTLLGFVAAALIASYLVWPRLRELPRSRALAILLAPHAFRFMGLSFLVEGVVSPSLPAGFAVPAAYGDMITAVLAMLAMVALHRRWSTALSLVWAVNVFGACDLLFAFYRGGAVGLDPRLLGATFFIPTALVPALLVAHALSFRVLVTKAAGRVHQPA
jgi:hypothetical protein